MAISACAVRRQMVVSDEEDVAKHKIKRKKKARGDEGVMFSFCKKGGQDPPD